MTTFETLGLAEPILRALREEGYETPTPIQAQAIPHVLEGRDLLGCAQTGTGKTAAFALPVLDNLHNEPVDKSRRGVKLPRVLVLSPTRELATQIAESFKTYGRHLGLNGAVIYGGVSQHRQVQSLRRGVDILVATPGRLMDLMDQGHIDFSAVGAFVLDEADRMLDMGFIKPIQRIAAALPEDRQTLLFSATMPREILRLAEGLLADPVKVSVTPVASAAPKIEQSVYMVPHTAKQALLNALVACPTVERAVVFTRTKHGADRVKKKLEQAGVTAEAIHGNKNQSQRNRALDGFKAGRSRVLVATDVAARGLDVDGVTHVFNYDLPNEPEAYVHRIGRTGRAGATGKAVAFCDRDERAYLKAIERLTGDRLPKADLPQGFEAHADHADADDADRRREDRPPYGGHPPRHDRPGHHRPARAPGQGKAGSPRHAKAKAARPGKFGARAAAPSDAAPRSAPRSDARPQAPRARQGQGAGPARTQRNGAARGPRSNRQY